jgi:hypothetical protein
MGVSKYSHNKRMQSDQQTATRVIGGWDESPFRVVRSRSLFNA